MPINNSKEPVKRLVTKKFDKPADNFELVNNLKCIKVSLLRLKEKCLTPLLDSEELNKPSLYLTPSPTTDKDV